MCCKEYFVGLRFWSFLWLGMVWFFACVFLTELTCLWGSEPFFLTIMRYLDYNTILWIATPERIKSYCVAGFLLPFFFLNQERKKIIHSTFSPSREWIFLFPGHKTFHWVYTSFCIFSMRLILLPHPNWSWSDYTYINKFSSRIREECTEPSNQC